MRLGLVRCHEGTIRRPKSVTVSGSAYLGVSPKAAQKEVERFAAKRCGRWGRLAYLAYKFERVFRKRNYVDIVDGKRR